MHAIKAGTIMMGLGLLGMLAILPAPAWSSPIDKALRALAEKNRLLAEGQSSTLTAQAGMTSNPTTAQAGNPGTAAANNPPVEVMSLATANNQAHDPMAITFTATAESIFVSWNNSPTAWANFGGYQLTRVDLTGDHAQAVTTVVVPLASYQDVSVQAKTYYEYAVTVLDGQGNSLQASNKLVAFLAPAQLPHPPVVLSGESLPERTQVRWQKAEKTSFDIEGYLVYRRLASEEPQCLNPAKPDKKDYYYDNTGQMGQTYEYYVATVDQRGQTSTASNTVTAYARPRDRNGLVLMSTAYRGNGLMDRGLNLDLQFTYYIGTLYGEQEPSLSPLAVYLDPISVWLLSGDIKYTALTERQSPLALAVGAKGGMQLFAGQQSTNSGSFTFSDKSEFDYLYGGYLALSRSFGQFGVHGGYLYGNYGNPIFYLSKYLDTEVTNQLVYLGFDFPIVRRMNAALEIIYPMQETFETRQHPYLINLHVDRLFNFDVSYMHWDQGWAFLGFFNIRFTVFQPNWLK